MFINILNHHCNLSCFQSLVYGFKENFILSVVFYLIFFKATSRNYSLRNHLFPRYLVVLVQKFKFSIFFLYLLKIDWQSSLHSDKQDSCGVTVRS